MFTAEWDLSIILLVIAGIVILWIILTFNSLIVLRNRIKNSLAQIDVQTKRRYDLIPNLVEAVKGYMKHERGVLIDVTKARTALGRAKNPNSQFKANDLLSGALNKLFAVAEDYPKLRASENFMQLQEELSGTESKIASARQFYNDAVLRFNAAIQQFPTNMFANVMGFKKEIYYEAESAAHKKSLKVKF
jgi:LemA protein